MHTRSIALLLFAATAPALAQAELQRSVQTMRDAGNALAAWLTDHDGWPQGTTENAAGPPSADWSQCPPVSHERAAELLQPDYIAELPRVDGWGHPIEICLRGSENEEGRFSIGIRSPGRDGRWDGSVYPVGAFDVEDVDRDVVWLDGFFVRWPEQRR